MKDEFVHKNLLVLVFEHFIYTQIYMVSTILLLTFKKKKKKKEKEKERERDKSD